MAQDRAKLNPLLTWLWEILSAFSSEEIKIPSGYTDKVSGVKEVLKSDTSGIVNSILDFAINCACVNYNIESTNEQLTQLISDWFKNINMVLVGKVPTGLTALSKEYYRERWKNSSLIVLRTIWETKDNLILPTKMWFVDGINIEIKNLTKTRIIGEEQYLLKVNDNSKDNKPLPAEKNEIIFVQKPYDSWSELYSNPFVIQRGLYKNLKLFELINKKAERIVGKALEYLMLLKKGTEALTLKGQSEYTYSEGDLKAIKADMKKMIADSKSEAGVPLYATGFDTEIEHIIPEYNRILQREIYATVEKRLLAGLGLVEIVEGVTSTRRESILNPRPFITEVESGIKDFIQLLTDVIKVIIEKNKDKHSKYFGPNIDIQLHYPPVKEFISDSVRDHLRSMYDRGILSKETYAEVVGDIDIDVEVKLRKQETTDKLDKVLYPPIIQNTENKRADLTPFEDIEVIPEEKTGPEKKNFKATVLFGAICKKCNNEFDYQNTPEVQMGGTKCPSCGEILTDNDIDFSRVYEEAPYKTNTDLPAQVKVLPSEAQSLWRKVFNQSYPKGEDYARKVAWSVVKKIFKRDKDGNWTKKSRTKGEEGWVDLEKSSIDDILDGIIKLQEIELREAQLKVANKILENKEEEK